jgi:glycosyltransferase involved in cell wall biosynthesis
MKIALLSEKYTPDIGGLAISAGRLAALLARAGHAVRVFAPTISVQASEGRTLPHSRVRVTRFGAHKRTDDTLVDWFELLVQEHKRESFDVFHAYFLPQAGFIAAYAGKYLNVPSVVSIRGNDIERAAFDPAKFSHVMYALQNASAVTTNASELEKKAKAFIDRKVFLIPNGIDAEHFKPGEMNEGLAEAVGLEIRNKKEERSLVIGFVGELREKKGLRALLSGYAQVTKYRPASLLIVGEVRAGEDNQALDEFRLSNPNSKIIVTGHIPHHDLPAYYALMDVFVHPSLRDGMPNAILEAMACGKPVVVTPVGGIMDVVEDHVNGITIPINDGDTLARAIETLATDEPLRKNLSQSARKTIVEKYTPEKELEANLCIYRNLGIPT